jgi:transposase-like protein
MTDWVSVGSFCPNEACADYRKVDIGNIIRYGKSGEGRQRFQCKTCSKTFNDRSGTLFHGRKTPVKDIIEVLAMLAEGMRISSISRVKGFKEDTVLDWLREAARHAEQVETVLLSQHQISQVQIDGLWTYVGRKEKKRSS